VTFSHCLLLDREATPTADIIFALRAGIRDTKSMTRHCK